MSGCCPYVEMIKCRGRDTLLEDSLSGVSAEQVQHLISQLQNLPVMKARSDSGTSSTLPVEQVLEPTCDAVVDPTLRNEVDKVGARVQSGSQSITNDKDEGVCEGDSVAIRCVSGEGQSASGSEVGANGLKLSGNDIGALFQVKTMELNKRITELTAENEVYKACVSRKLCWH